MSYQRGTSLKEGNLKLFKEWHPTKNLDLKPENVTRASATKIWWMCKQGHSWKTSVHNRSKGSGCPFCRKKTLHKIDPNLAREWHPLSTAL